MTGFKVGDRVIYDSNGGKGTITRFDNRKIWVSWDDANQAETYVAEHEISKYSPSGSDSGAISFEQNVHRITDQIADLLIAKNKQYSNSALDPIRVFSKADRMEQLRVRADDKLSRIRNGDTSEDAVLDLCGYLILMKIAGESE